MIRQLISEHEDYNFLGLEIARWGRGLPRERVVAEKPVPSHESLFSFNSFEGREPDTSRGFRWGMSQTPL